MAEPRKKLHSALFVVTAEKSKRWNDFLGQLGGELERIGGFARIAENVWLLDLTASPDALGVLIYQAQANLLPYGILPFDEAPQWLPASFCPKTIPARSA
jgi:hypothetical protein